MEDLQLIQLDKLAPSPLNPRKTFDETKTAELADFAKQAEADIPEPKSWASLNADGTPKAKPGKKPKPTKKAAQKPGKPPRKASQAKATKKTAKKARS